MWNHGKKPPHHGMIGEHFTRFSGRDNYPQRRGTRPCTSNKGLWACGILCDMQTPLYVRPLTADERAILETGLRSSSAFTVRRCQILLASAEGQATTTIAHDLRCTDQTVRNALHAFHQRGLTALQPQSSRPHTTAMI